MKISFLIAVHNEEKILEKSLNHLAYLFLENYEVLLGLDGCEDNSEAISLDFQKRFPQIFKVYVNNERGGKHVVINKLVKLAKGELIIINDVDWYYIGSEKQFDNLLRLFEDPQIGGVSEQCAVEYSERKVNFNRNICYLGTAFFNQCWVEYHLNKYRNSSLIKKKRFYLLVNVLRKKLFVPNATLADDLERSRVILDKGYKIEIVKGYYPRMVALYDQCRFGDVYKQKVRTGVARNQITMKQFGFAYYIGFSFYLIGKLFYPKKNFLRIFAGTILYYLLTFLGSFKSKFVHFSSKEGWTLRAKR